MRGDTERGVDSEVPKERIQRPLASLREANLWSRDPLQIVLFISLQTGLAYTFYLNKHPMGCHRVRPLAVGWKRHSRPQGRIKILGGPRLGTVMGPYIPSLIIAYPHCISFEAYHPRKKIKLQTPVSEF